MSRKKKVPPPEPTVHTTDIVPTKSGNYSLDFVKHLFINSDLSVDELASQMNVSVDVIKHHAKQGLKNWYDLKKENFPARMRHFIESDLDNLVETHSALDDGHWLTIVQIKGYQQFLKDYFAKNGHLFRLNEDGEISMDTYGMPIPLPLPNTPKHFMALEAFLKMKEGTKAALNQVFEESKKGTQSDVVDVKDFFDKEE